MPLSLRRSKNTPQTFNSKRTVSTPTLLSRFRSSAFTSSKVSLLATSPYELVQARTPPTTISHPPSATKPLIKRSKPYGALHANWRAESRRLKTPEQRDCLFGAECVEIRDPLLGRLDSPDVSIDLEYDMSNLSISMIREVSTDIEMMEHTQSPQSPARYPYHTLPHTPSPRPRICNLLKSPALRKRVPISSTYITRRPTFKSYRMTTVLEAKSERLSVDRGQCDSSSFSSPIIVPLHSPDMTRPRSPTPHRMSSRSVSPLTP